MTHPINITAEEHATQEAALSVNARGNRSLWRRYVFSRDHRVVGLQFFFLALFAVVVGVTLSALMRLNVTWPGTAWPVLATLFPVGAPGGVIRPEFYLALLTMHGTLMVFFVLTVAPQSGFGNYFLPLQIGARNMAFPVLSLLSFWGTFASLLVLLAAFFVEGGPPIAGWTSYPTLSALGEEAGPGLGAGQNLWIISLLIFSIATLLGSVNFITTFLTMRTRGLTLMRLPLTCWAWFTTAMLSLLAFPVLVAAGLLLLLDRTAGTSFFIPGGLILNDRVIDYGGGSPILWQHLFWFFGHPEVYIAILPSMGVVSHVLSVFARKPVFGYRAMVLATLSIGGLGFFVWGHHMFVSGMNPYLGAAFSVLTLVIGAPSAVKTFNWIGTLWGGELRLTAPMLFAIGFVSVFVIGGLSGLVLGQTSLNIYMHDTYFVVAHFHLIMGMATSFGIFAATYFWFPRMFGKMMSERLGKIHFYLTFCGAYLIFVPMHVLGLAGMPRRYAQFTAYSFLEALHPLVVFITLAAILTALAQFVFLFNFGWSLYKGQKASGNPWQATTLEWTPSPPNVSNENNISQAARPLVVYRGAYDYSVPGVSTDFVHQTVSDAALIQQAEQPPAA